MVRLTPDTTTTSRRRLGRMKRVLRGVWIAVVAVALSFGLILLSEMAGLQLAAKAE